MTVSADNLFLRSIKKRGVTRTPLFIKSIYMLVAARMVIITVHCASKNNNSGKKQCPEKERIIIPHSKKPPINGDVMYHLYFKN